MYLSGAISSNGGFSGRSGVGFIVCHSGTPADAEKILRQIRSAGTPIADSVKPIDYVALQRSGDLDEKRAIGSYSKTGFVKKISPQLIDAMVNGLEEHPQRQTACRIPALRWRDLAHRKRCHGFPAPGHPCHFAADSRLARQC